MYKAVPVGGLLICCPFKSGEGVLLMKNKKNIFGIIILSAVLGFLIMSCEIDTEYTWKFINQSDYTVHIINANFSPSEFTLEPGTTRSFTNSNTVVKCDYSPSDLVDCNKSATSSGGSFTFKDKP